MDRSTHPARETAYGTIAISTGAIAEIVGIVAAESYGIVGMAVRRGIPKLLARERLTDGITVRAGEDGLTVEMGVVVEYGLNLAEVASTVRNRVTYEVERLTGLRVASVDVRIEQARRS